MRHLLFALLIAFVLTGCGGMSKEEAKAKADEERNIQRILDSLDRRPTEIPEYIVRPPQRFCYDHLVYVDSFRAGKRNVVFSKFDFAVRDENGDQIYKNSAPDVLYTYEFNDSALCVLGKYGLDERFNEEILILTTPESVEMVDVASEDYREYRSEKDFTPLLNLYLKYSRPLSGKSTNTKDAKERRSQVNRLTKRHDKGILYMLDDSLKEVWKIRYAPKGCSDSIDSVYYHNLPVFTCEEVFFNIFLSL